MENSDETVPVIDLSRAPGSRSTWSRPLPVLVLWLIVETLLVRNSLQVSSRLRAIVLRAFGATIGPGVVLRSMHVTFPWNLEIGARSWIGEGVFFHNQDRIVIGADVVVSQQTFLTTGSHRRRTDMGLVTRPIVIDDGAWITSRCVVLGGAHVGRSAMARPLTVVRGTVQPGDIVAGPLCEAIGRRFEEKRSA